MCTLFDLVQLIAALLIFMLLYLALLPQIEYVFYLIGSISEKLRRRGK